MSGKTKIAAAVTLRRGAKSALRQYEEHHFKAKGDHKNDQEGKRDYDQDDYRNQGELAGPALQLRMDPPQEQNRCQRNGRQYQPVARGSREMGIAQARQRHQQDAKQRQARNRLNNADGIQNNVFRRGIAASP